MAEYNTLSMEGYQTTWEAYGYRGAGNVSSLINCHIDRPAVAVGSAKGVFEELAIVQNMYGPDSLVTIAANDVGMYIKNLDHWVSLHGEAFPAWKSVRWIRPTHSKPTYTHTYNSDDGADYHWDKLAPAFALSGYFAMQIAFIMGCNPIILAGCPGDATPRFFEFETPGPFKYGGGPTTGDKGVRQQIVEEVKRIPLLKERVRAMSGFNKELFGGI